MSSHASLIDFLVSCPWTCDAEDRRVKARNSSVMVASCRHGGSFWQCFMSSFSPLSAACLAVPLECVHGRIVSLFSLPRSLFLKSYLIFLFFILFRLICTCPVVVHDNLYFLRTATAHNNWYISTVSSF
jgi:hypothetical protein